jgi:hypothetical protein
MKYMNTDSQPWLRDCQSWRVTQPSAYRPYKKVQRGGAWYVVLRTCDVCKRKSNSLQTLATYSMADPRSEYTRHTSHLDVIKGYLVIHLADRLDKTNKSIQHICHLAKSLAMNLLLAAHGVFHVAFQKNHLGQGAPRRSCLARCY